MQVKYAIIANAVVRAGGGQWTIVGTFNTIRVKKDFPGRHGAIGLLIRVEGHPREAGSHTLRVDFVNQLGEVVENQSSSGEFVLDPKSVIPGTPPYCDVAIGFPNGLVLTEAGNFDFAIHIDDTYIDSVPLYVRQVDEQGRIV